MYMCNRCSCVFLPWPDWACECQAFFVRFADRPRPSAGLSRAACVVLQRTRGFFFFFFGGCPLLLLVAGLPGAAATVILRIHDVLSFRLLLALFVKQLCLPPFARTAQLCRELSGSGGRCAKIKVLGLGRGGGGCQCLCLILRPHPSPGPGPPPAPPLSLDL